MNLAEVEVPKIVKNPTKFRDVPIAVTPEGFWCCPYPVGFQKSVKHQNPQNKLKTSSCRPAPKSSSPKKQTLEAVKKPICTIFKPPPVSAEQVAHPDDTPPVNGSAETCRPCQPKTENIPRKVLTEFGEHRASDLKLILLGKHGFRVKLSVHRNTLMEKSNFFAKKISGEPIFPCMEIEDCEDVEAYADTVGLMYCPDLKQQLKKQNVSRILSILKVAEQLGYTSCVESCLEYLEAVPWVGEDEEEKVINSVLSLQSEGIGVSPVLKRVSSNITNPPHDTLSHILELVLKSNEERGRQKIKSVVLKLLRRNSSSPSLSSSVDNSYDIIYGCSRSCLDVLLTLFRQAGEPDFCHKSKEFIMKQAVVQADNLSWLLEILADRRAADEFAMLWAIQKELAVLHAKLPLASRYHVSCITARLFVGIGSGELLPSKDTRHLMLQTWLQPLINDYSWLQHGCKSFDIKELEEGIGRTILTLPLQDQQTILLSWLGNFLKAGDNCPNLHRAFEVWWRRTFVRPYLDSGNLHQSKSPIPSNMVE